MWVRRWWFEGWILALFCPHYYSYIPGETYGVWASCLRQLRNQETSPSSLSRVFESFEFYLLIHLACYMSTWIWGFHKWGYPWFKLENPIKMDDLVVSLSQEMILWNICLFEVFMAPFFCWACRGCLSWHVNKEVPWAFGQEWGRQNTSSWAIASPQIYRYSLPILRFVWVDILTVCTPMPPPLSHCECEEMPDHR